MKKQNNLILDYSKIIQENIEYLEKDLGLNWVYRKGEAFQLLSHITKQFNNITIIDAGTHYGWSAYCLKENPKNKVITYDITDRFNNEYLKAVSNVEVKILDINKEDHQIIHSAEVIYLDIDPHDGLQEKVFTDLLDRIEWQGYLFCDDIHINSGMENWWNSINLDKYDLTEVGHTHGTGLVTYNREISIIK
jgi:predicted O-methyltransferase YrrM